MASPNQIYQTVAFRKPARSMFNLSHTWKSTCDFAQLIPNLCLEVLPGDAIKARSNIFMRAMPLKSPVMHNVDVYQHYFFVPYRLIWDNYEKFFIPQDGETQETIPQMPYFTYLGKEDPPVELIPLMQNVGTLLDYMGVPPQPEGGVDDEFLMDTKLSSLPFRAYALIWNEYYRDQNLMDPIEFSKGDGLESTADLIKLLTLRYRAWEKDYFTSALPSPQKNDPIGINAAGHNMSVELDLAKISANQRQQILTTQSSPAANATINRGAQGDLYLAGQGQGNFPGAWLDPNGTFVVSGDNYITIEQLRQQMRLQEFMEDLMRGGSRYAEVVRNMFGVTPDDLRLGRPQYLGGGKQNLVISEVLQQSQTVQNESALGDMAGHAISIGSDNRFKGFFKEHGLIIGIMSVRPRSEYGQGVDKFFLKDDRYQFAFPRFAHLGEQPVLNGEVFFSGDGKNNQGFGYQPIYEEYRHKPSTVHGDLRTNLAWWTLNRRFTSRPNLNADFVQMSPSDFHDIFALTSASDGSHLICEVEHLIKAVRPLPKSGIPTL